MDDVEKQNRLQHLQFVQWWADGEDLQILDKLGEWLDRGKLQPAPTYGYQYRIKPRWYRVALCLASGFSQFAPHCVYTEDGEAEITTYNHFIKWLTDRIYYEI